MLNTGLFKIQVNLSNPIKKTQMLSSGLLMLTALKKIGRISKINCSINYLSD